MPGTKQRPVTITITSLTQRTLTESYLYQSLCKCVKRCYLNFIGIWYPWSPQIPLLSGTINCNFRGSRRFVVTERWPLGQLWSTFKDLCLKRSWTPSIQSLSPQICLHTSPPPTLSAMYSWQIWARVLACPWHSHSITIRISHCNTS